MLRIAIPYGTLNGAQMRMLGHVARTYDRGYGHFTTRTNLQLHWIKLRDAPDILADLAKVGLHAIQTSGNCIRNLTADPARRGHGGRDRRSSGLGRGDPAVVDLSSGILLPAAQVQDRRHRLAHRSRGGADLRHRPAATPR